MEMKRPSFAHAPAPLVVGVIKEKDTNAVIRKIREGEFAGARGFDLHLSTLEPEFRTVEELGRMIAATTRPILALNYDIVNFTEEERVESLLQAVEAGCAAVDMQAYTFDRASKEGFVDDIYIPTGMEFLAEKKPREISLKPGVIARQKALIDRVHAMGAEVLVSVHVGCALAREELEAIARFNREKGADIVKMVGTCTDKYQVPEAIAATMYLNEKLDFPFSYHMNGLYGIPTRKLCPLFGSKIVFCNVDYSGPGADTEQLQVRGMIDAYRALGVL